jgi:hypothetical protein
MATPAVSPAEYFAWVESEVLAGRYELVEADERGEVLLVPVDPQVAVQREKMLRRAYDQIFGFATVA